MKRIGTLTLIGVMLAQAVAPAWAADASAPSPWTAVLAGIGVQEGKSMPSAQYQALVKKLAAFPPVATKIRQASTKPISISEWAQILKGLGIQPKPQMSSADWAAILAQAGVDVSKGVSPSLAQAGAPVVPSTAPAISAAPAVSTQTQTSAPVVLLSHATQETPSTPALAPTPAVTLSTAALSHATTAPAATAVMVSSVSAAVPSTTAPVVLSSATAASLDASPIAPVISLELRGMDINEVLKTIGRQGSLNIVTSANVRGSVSISLKNVDLWEAFRLILEANDLAYAYDGTIVRVMTSADYEKLYGARFDDKTVIETVALKNVKASAMGKYLDSLKTKLGKILVYDYNNTLIMIDTPDSIKRMKELAHHLDGEMRIKIYPLNYAKVDDILPKIQPLVTKDIGDIEIDKRTNRMVVMDFSERFGPIDTVIAAFDQKHRSVLIEAKILQISLNKSHQMGINWQYIFSHIGDHNVAGNIASNFAFLPVPLPGGTQAFTASLGTLTDNNYTALIQALDSVGKTSLLSAPRITAINNELANILVGTREAYVTTTVTTPGTGVSTTAEQINFVDVGVKLHVTPTIGEDNYITLKIKPEVSSVDHTLTTAQGNVVPIVRTSQAESSVVVKNGDTILLAGLIEDNKSKTNTGIPWLSRIPILGIPFRATNKTETKTDISVLLTTHIMPDDLTGGPAPALPVPDKDLR